MNGLGGAMVARWTSTNCTLRLIQRLRVRAPPEMLFAFWSLFFFLSPLFSFFLLLMVSFLAGW